MAKLSKEQQKMLSTFMKKNNLVAFINKHLADNGMEDFVVESLHLTNRESTDIIYPDKNGNCPIGTRPKEYCKDGSCETRCIPIRKP